MTETKTESKIQRGKHYEGSGAVSDHADLRSSEPGTGRGEGTMGRDTGQGESMVRRVCCKCREGRGLGAPYLYSCFTPPHVEESRGTTPGGGPRLNHAPL